MQDRASKVKRIMTSLGLIVVATATVSCGTSQPGVAAINVGTSTKTSTAAGTSGKPGETAKTDSSCKSASDCAKADMSLSSTALQNGAFIGTVGENINWSLQGVDKNSSSRRVGILLNNVPEGASFSPSDVVETSVKITWKPTAPVKSINKLEVFLRDMDLCEVTESNRDDCAEYRYIEEYDQKLEYDWEIKASKDNIDTKANAKTGPKPDSVAVAKPSAPAGPAVGGSSPLPGLGGLSGGLGGLTGGAGGIGGLSNLGSLTSLLGGSGGAGGLLSQFGGLGGLTNLLPVNGSVSTSGASNP